MSRNLTTDEARRAAREDCARELKKHEERQGRESSFESCYRHVCNRADVRDKKKDWGERG